jgi:hypothetical protein
MQMTKTDQTDAVLQRAAMLAFMYYPEIHVAEPDYVLANDIDFCMELLDDLDDEARDRLRDLIGRAIIDPTEYRTGLFATLADLADSEVDNE